MQWRRHLKMVRACSAAGLLLTASLGRGAIAQGDEPATRPDPKAGIEQINVIEAEKTGAIGILAKGDGADKVRFSVHNKTDRRLKVILPPGLIASSGAVGQQPLGGGGAGGAGGGGAFQSMGLGAPGNLPGGFGTFTPIKPAKPIQATQPSPGSDAGFRSVPAAGPESKDNEGIVIPAGQTVSFTLPSVCLNYGVRTPESRDRFHLMDVNDYTADPRARKTLRGLATIGTSRMVAQAVVWHVFNGLGLQQLAMQDVEPFNAHELALAARIVEAIDAGGPDSPLDPNTLRRGRILARIHGESGLEKQAAKLAEELEGRSILGLPVDIVSDAARPYSSAPALFVDINLTSTKPGKTFGRLNVLAANLSGGWNKLGGTPFAADSAIDQLSGETLAKGVDHAIAVNFVNAKFVRRTSGTTTFRIENKLPFSLSTVVFGTGREGANVTLEGLGVGPLRASQTVVPAAKAVIERVELNGF